MRFFRDLGLRSLVGAALVVAAPAILAQAAQGLGAVPKAAMDPALSLPAIYRNAPADAVTGATRDPALGDAELARLIALTRTFHPGRAQVAARGTNTRRGFLGGDAEQRFIEAELARIDLQVAEETAHAYFDLRAANAKLDIGRVLEALAAQGLQLTNQRLAAGLAAHADLERMTETAIKARGVTARTQQERAASAARLNGLTGAQAADLAGPLAASLAKPLATPTAAPIAITYPIRSSLPAELLGRPEVRAARIRQESREASVAELAAYYREAVLKALEDTEGAYATAVSARAQRTATADLAAAAARQAALLLVQLEAGRIGRVQHIEAETAAQEARLRTIDAEAAYAKALASLERALGK